jgi:hypothetical protein
VSDCGISGLTIAISSSIVTKSSIELQWGFNGGPIGGPGRLYLITVRRLISGPHPQRFSRGRFYLITVRKAVPESAHTVRLVDLIHKSFPAYSVNE